MLSDHAITPSARRPALLLLLALVALIAAILPSAASARVPTVIQRHFTPLPGTEHSAPALFPSLPAPGDDPSAKGATARAFALPGASTAPSSQPHPHGQLLSDERTYGRWAHPADESRSPVYRDASYGSKVVGHLHPYTEDGFDEVYLLLRSTYDSQGREWVRIRLPQRPNGTLGWVRREALGSFRLVRRLLVVDRHSLRATLFVNGHRVWHAPVGVGKRSTPTPGGHFWIREGFRVHGVPTYGPYAFGTADYSVLSDWPGGGVVGIHGTDEPRLVPGRPSHGCMRMHNRDVAWLSHHLPVGTPLLIR